MHQIQLKNKLRNLTGTYNIYENTFHQFSNYLTNVGTQECLGKRRKLDFTAKCTEICGNKPKERSCAKICLANSKDQPERKVKAYVVLDEQSNYALAKPELF